MHQPMFAALLFVLNYNLKPANSARGPDRALDQRCRSTDVQSDYPFQGPTSIIAS